MSRDTDLPTLTLVTCYPFGALMPGGPLRYVVTAEIEQPAVQSFGGLNRARVALQTSVISSPGMLSSP